MDIAAAELAIARILADLEASTGDWVETVEIVSHEVTQAGSARPEWARRVEIKVKPKPGTKWAI